MCKLEFYFCYILMIFLVNIRETEISVKENYADTEIQVYIV